MLLVQCLFNETLVAFVISEKFLHFILACIFFVTEEAIFDLEVSIMEYSSSKEASDIVKKHGGTFDFEVTYRNMFINMFFFLLHFVIWLVSSCFNHDSVTLKIILSAKESLKDCTIKVFLSCVEGDFLTADELQSLQKILQDGVCYAIIPLIIQATQLFVADGEPFDVVFENMTKVSTDWLDWKFGAGLNSHISHITYNR